MSYTRRYKFKLVKTSRTCERIVEWEHTIGKVCKTKSGWTWENHVNETGMRNSGGPEKTKRVALRKAIKGYQNWIK